MNNKQILKRICFYLRADAPLFLLQLAAALVNVISALYLPILFGRAVDLIVGQGKVDITEIAAILLKGVVVAAAGGISGWILTAVSNRLSYRIVKALREDAVSSLMRLPISYIDRQATGDLVSRVITDADAVGEGLLLGFSQLFTGFLTILATLVFMFRLDYRVALIVVVLTPMSLFAAAFIAARSKKYFKQQSEYRGEQTGMIDEVVGSQKVVSAFGMGESYEKRFDEINRRLAGAALSATFFSSLTNPVTRFVNACVYALVALFGAMSVTGGMFSVGELTIFLSYASQYTKPFNEITGVITELQNAIVCAGRVLDVIDETPFYDVGAEAAEKPAGEVDFDHVFFSYEDAKPLIENFNLHINKGTRVAIVGPTGCGKTTLINLIMRFYDVKQGSLRMDGIDVRQLPVRTLRSSIGMVLQDVWIKNATVRENIRMGKPGASDEEIQNAARLVHADGFISRLENGYDTMLGEGGVILSTGEAQLLCISRVMLALPDMLILDEATSSIDTRTEVYIQNSFAYLMENRTSFVVAHRLSTIKNSDLIIVMNDGHIVEQGNHAALMAQNGFYAELYRSGTG